MIHSRKLETALWAIGGLCLAIFASAKLHAHIAQQAAIVEIRTPSEVDQALWSESRKAKYDRARQAVDAGDVLAVLTIESIGLEVAVFEGTGPTALNAGLGRVEGTASVGGSGNLAIAGHRDGFFRGLKDIRVGDEIILQTGSQTLQYDVSEFFVVDPEDVFVLDSSDENLITLITCYPFYFVGAAPRRFIVRGRMKDSSID